VNFLTNFINARKFPERKSKKEDPSNNNSKINPDEIIEESDNDNDVSSGIDP
jgi:hypothetical protein